MKRAKAFAGWMVAVALSVLAAGAARGGERTLFDFEGGFDLASLPHTDVRLEMVPGHGGTALRMHMGHSSSWPGIVLKPVGQPTWNLGAFDWVAVTLHNRGATKATLTLRFDTRAPGGTTDILNAYATLRPRERKTLRLWFRRRPPPELPTSQLFGMRGLPGGFVARPPMADPRQTVQMVLFGLRPKTDAVIDVDDVRAGGAFTYPSWLSTQPTRFFPMIDRYGQFILEGWPGKVTRDVQLQRARVHEDGDLQAHPRPVFWDRFGGWRWGPRTRGTGHFRAVKYGRAWWLVDPEGALFFSTGVDVIGLGSATPIRDREHWFRNLPAAGGPFGAFRGTSWAAPSGYYVDKVPYETYDFAAANLFRKYGPSWRTTFRDRTHRRLHSWGFNTIGAWSDGVLAAQRRTAYTVACGSGGSKIEGPQGAFPDPFDPAFQASLDQTFANQVGKTAGDPWCLGYFIDNEPGWPWAQDGIGLAVLQSSKKQPAKRALVVTLRRRYRNIWSLNRAWGTRYDSWAGLLSNRTPSPNARNHRDLLAFSQELARRYFSTCRQALKRVAPEGLYLGCRFQSSNPLVVREAARYCDVVSFNIYRRELRSFKLPPGVDVPVLIGEFHFGALDRGPFHAGLPTSDQAGRAAAFERYMRGALTHRQIVGSHWFQMRDEATTGRFDGENANIGFLDVADNPYRELVAAARRIGQVAYPLRFAWSRFGPILAPAPRER